MLGLLFTSIFLTNAFDRNCSTVTVPQYLGTHQFDLFCISTIFISSAFSVLRPLYFDLSTSTSLLRLAYFELCTSNSVLGLAYFDLCTSTFCQICTSYWSRSTRRNTVLVEVKFGHESRSKV